MTYALKNLVSLNDTPYYHRQIAPCICGVPTIHGGRMSSLVVFAAHGFGASTSMRAETIRTAKTGYSSGYLNSRRSSLISIDADDDRGAFGHSLVICCTNLV